MRFLSSKSRIRNLAAYALAFTASANIAVAAPKPQPPPATQSELMGMPSFQGVVLAIANVNAAMEFASKNPINKQARAQVQGSIRALAPAVMILAKDFGAGKLGNEDLPLVQSLLGGFVDPTAPNRFKKFMERPDASLIPQVAPSLKAYLKNTSIPVQYAAVSSQSAGKSVAAPEAATSTSAEVVNLSTADYIAQAPANGGVRSGGSADSGLVIDDSATRGAVANSPAATKSANTSGSEVSRDVASANSADVTTTSPAVLMQEVSQAETRVAQNLSTEDPDFFNRLRASDKKDSRGKLGKAKKNKFWSATPIFYIAETLLIQNARAESCGGPSGGTGDGGGQKDGQKAMMALMGVAQIISAIAPIIAAVKQAETDQYIADKTAETQQLGMRLQFEANDISTKRSMETTVFQTKTAKEVNDANNQARMDQQNAQIVALRANQQELAAAAERQAQRDELYNNARIAFARENMLQQQIQNDKLFAYEATKAGFSQGIQSSVNSVNRLGVSRSSLSNDGTVASAQGLGDPGAGAASLSGGGAALPAMVSRQTAMATTTGPATPNGQAMLGARGIVGSGGIIRSPSSTSVAGYTPDSGDDEDEDALKKKKVKARNRNGVRSIVGRPSARLLSQGVKGKTTRIAKAVTPTKAAVQDAGVPALVKSYAAGSDLNEFVQQTAADKEASLGFAQFRKGQYGLSK